jgi:hypothetical protein
MDFTTIKYVIGENLYVVSDYKVCLKSDKTERVARELATL